MSNVEGLLARLDKVIVGIGVVTETAATIADVVDQTGLAIVKGIEHLTDVFVEVDSALDTEEPVEGEPAYTEAVEEFNTNTIRGSKIKVIQDYMLARGIRDSLWTRNPDAYSDKSVESIYAMVMGKKRMEDDAKQRLNADTRGDRFGLINPSSSFGRHPREW